jgi:hypothetical protein
MMSGKGGKGGDDYDGGMMSGKGGKGGDDYDGGMMSGKGGKGGDDYDGGMMMSGKGGKHVSSFCYIFSYCRSPGLLPFYKGMGKGGDYGGKTEDEDY